ncbi:MAG: hypothetical protein IJS03_02770 [Eubacterium sp.]|nr:hypothetical protein [Eubacterium sp.]
MRISKKIVAIALSVLMAVSMMPFTVFAATTTVANGAELKAAVAAAADGDVIEFTADNTTYPATTSGALVIPVDGKDITIDLKGHTQYFRVSGETTVTYPTDLFVLKNGAKLTVKDSVGGGAIYATYGANSSAYIFNVLDTSELVIDSGKYVMDKANRSGVIIYQNSADASTTINDGEFETVTNTGATRTYRDYIINNSRGEVVINDGTFTTGKSSDYVISEGNTTDTTLVINDGEFNGTMSLDTSKATTELNGGTYLTNAGEPNTAVSAYLPADQIIDNTTGEIKNVDASTVARTNSAEFTSLKDALDSVAAGATATITLLDDCTLASTYEIADNQKITIDLNGNDITTTARAFNIRHGQLTLKGTGNLNANFTGANAAVAVYGAATDSGSNYSTFTLTSPATINAPNGYGAMIGATSGAAYGAKLQLGGTINSKYGVYINGNVAEPAVKTNAAAINITGTVTASNENAVVYAAGYAKWNIYSNANLTGGSGVYIKSGTMNIYGNAAITATGEKTDYKFNTNGANGTGDAIIIDSCGYPGNVPTVTVKAGTITSANGAAVASYAKQDDPLYPTADFPRVDNVIPGNSTAVFSSNVTALAAEDYKTVYDETAGGYVIAPIAYGTIGLYQAGDAEITGNGTAHEKITISNSSLSYADPDYSVGRYYAGYYMGGIKFIAPEGTVISENARYTNGSIDSTTGQLKVKNLYTAKDGANFMYSWPHVTVESLEAAIAAGENKTWEYTFDWDGDGYFEQEAIIELVCDTVKLVKDGEQVYPEGNNGYSVISDSTTSMNAYIDVAAYADEDNASVVVTYNNNEDGSSTSGAIDKDSASFTVTNATATKQSGGTYDGNWVINVEQAPAQMNDDITIEIYDGATKVKTITTSIVDYCLQASEELPAGDEKNFVEAMYDYGKAIYEAGGFIGGTYTAENFEHAFFNTAAPDFSQVTAATAESTEAFSFVNFAFVATSTPSLRVYTNLTADDAAILGYNTETAPNAYIGTNDKVFIDLGAIRPEDFDEQKTATLGNASAQVSVLNYAKAAYDNGATDLGRSLYNYNVAAEAYFE